MPEVAINAPPAATAASAPVPAAEAAAAAVAAAAVAQVAGAGVALASMTSPLLNPAQSPSMQQSPFVAHFRTAPVPFPRPAVQRAPQRLAVNDFHLLEPSSHHDEEEIQTRIEAEMITEMKESAPRMFEFSDCLDLVQQGVQVLVDDSFTKCFTQRPSRPWNWNIYLFPWWVVGIVIRYCVLFPFRLAALVAGWVVFAFLFIASGVFMSKSPYLPLIQRKLITMLCNVFVLSWHGVIKFHGVRPPRKANQIYVANHTTMADVIIMMMQQAYSIVGQAHPGWLGFVQKRVLGCLGCLWFERTSMDDRQRVSAGIQAHIRDPSRPPLLIFPEGTCVNNEYCVMFKKGVFELGATIVPVAIKYNKIFCDAFWHSRKESFAWYLVRLMTSWCVVCDVYYLDPVTIQEGESAEDFATRVKLLICNKAGLKPVPWDGYLKFFKPSPKYMQQQQKLVADSLRRRLEALPVSPAPPKGPLRVTSAAEPTDSGAAAASAPTGPSDSSTSAAPSGVRNRGKAKAST